MAAVEVVAQHGWGFGAWCWDGWRAVLPEGFVLRAPDRGYFGPATEAPRPDLLIVHSLGLHLIPPASIAAAGAVAILGGFRHFHPPDARAARRSRRTVERMLARLQREPEALLADFHMRCGAAGVAPQGAPAAARLRGDLLLLQDAELDLGPLRGKDKVVILHGDRDGIVPEERARELHGHLPASAFRVLAGAGHALPLTHARACWKLIAEACDCGN